MASLLDGEDSYEAAQKQKNISAEDLIDMLMIAGKYLKSRGENEKASSQFRIAKKIMDAFSEDFVERKWFNSTVYERTSDRRAEIEKLLNEWFYRGCKKPLKGTGTKVEKADVSVRFVFPDRWQKEKWVSEDSSPILTPDARFHRREDGSLSIKMLRL